MKRESSEKTSSKHRKEDRELTRKKGNAKSNRTENVAGGGNRSQEA